MCIRDSGGTAHQQMGVRLAQAVGDPFHQLLIRHLIGGGVVEAGARHLKVFRHHAGGDALAERVAGKAEHRHPGKDGVI